MNFESGNYCTHHRHRLFDQTTKQTLNNSEPPKTLKI